MPNVTVCLEFETPSKHIIDRFFFPAGHDTALRDPNIEWSQVPHGFFSCVPVSDSAVPLQFVDRFCSSSCPFRFSPSIVSALLVD